MRVIYLMSVSLLLSCSSAKLNEAAIRQSTDYSCGAAALATLLRYGFDDTVSEAQLLQQLLKGLSAKQQTVKKKNGFSLLDLQTVAEQRGYKAMGFHITLENLAKLRSPVIVFIQPHGYKHFAVLKTIQNNHVNLADPSVGHIELSASGFLTIWQNAQGKGIIFVLERKDGTAAHSFK